MRRPGFIGVRAMSDPAPAPAPPTGCAWGVFARSGGAGRAEIVDDRNDAATIARDLRHAGHDVAIVGWWRTIGLDGRPFSGWCCICTVPGSAPADRGETSPPTPQPHPHKSPALEGRST
jgi:hypothetical protein